MGELGEAIVLEIGQTQMDFSAVPTDPQDIIRYCGGLVTISNDTEEAIGLAHFSVKEFLLSDRIRESEVADFWAGDPHIKTDLAAICVSYISMTDFEEGQCPTVKRHLSRLSTFRFLDYAANFWVKHYKQVQDTCPEDLFKSVCSFLRDKHLNGNVLAWQQAEEYTWSFYPDKYRLVDLWGRDIESKMALVELYPPLFYAAQLGLTKVLCAFIEYGDDLNVRSSGSYEYPILTAAFRDNHDWEVVQILVNAGADINVCTFEGNVGCALAKHAGPAHWELLKELVRRGIDLETQSRYRVTAKPVITCIAGHPTDPAELVRYLIEAGADFKQTSPGSTDTGIGVSVWPFGGPPLQVAALTGNLEVVKVLVAAGASLDFAQCVYGSPLQAAVSRNQDTVVRHLLESDLDINAKGGRLGTALQAASWIGNETMVSTLLEAGADISIGGGLFGGPLAAAVSRQHRSLVKLLLDRGAIVEGDIESEGFEESAFPSLYMDNNMEPPLNGPRYRNALNWAVSQSDVEMVETLLRAGAGPNTPIERCYQCLNRRQGQNNQRHPLCIAVSKKSYGAVQTLLLHGADVEIGGYCPLICAGAAGNITTFRTLFERVSVSCDKELLIAEVLWSCSVEEGFLQELLKLFESENIEAEGGAHRALIARAALEGSTTLLSYYVSKGWNVNAAQTRWGDGYATPHQPPLVVAIRNRQMEATKFLLDHGGGPNIPSEQNGRALLAAVHANDVEVVKRLLSIGADPNLPSKTDGNALFAAVKNSNIEIISRLLSMGAEPDSDIDLYRACGKLVHHAASKQDVEPLKVLLDNGANVTAQCDWCPNTLMAAVDAESVPAIRFLVGRGLDVDQGDWYGRTPLFRASTSFRDDSAKTLLELGAQMHLPRAEVDHQIDDTVRRLCHVLLQMSKTPEGGRERGENDWRYSRYWVLLARGLLLGHDELNGMIAVEHCGSKILDEPMLQGAIRCQLCTLYQTGMYHFCTEGVGDGICPKCTKKHWASLGDAASSHAFVQYPRPFYLEVDIPAGCVALAKDKYILREEWLENIIATWHSKPAAGT